MKYEKAKAEVVKFDEYLEFMAGSLSNGNCNQYRLPNGGLCDSYQPGQQCSQYTDGDGDYCPSYNSYQCNNYDHVDPTFHCGSFTASACWGYGEGEFGWIPPTCDNFNCSGF